jgi:hypothetical protein
MLFKGQNKVTSFNHNWIMRYFTMSSWCYFNHIRWLISLSVFTIIKYHSIIHHSVIHPSHRNAPAHTRTHTKKSVIIETHPRTHEHTQMKLTNRVRATCTCIPYVTRILNLYQNRGQFFGHWSHKGYINAHTHTHMDKRGSCNSPYL